MPEHLWINPSLISQLKDRLAGDLERVGFILASGDIVEVVNICDDPENGFDVSDRDLAKYCDAAVGTWHTHPNGTKLLSVGDYESYLANDDLIHFIVAPDGVGIYRIEEGMVMNHPLPE